MVGQSSRHATRKSPQNTLPTNMAEGGRSHETRPYESSASSRKAMPSALEIWVNEVPRLRDPVSTQSPARTARTTTDSELTNGRGSTPAEIQNSSPLTHPS